MSRGVNKVILVGNLGDNPEVRNTSNGSSVTSLRVATSEQWRDRQNGQMVERTEWHRVVIFGKLAEIAGQYLRKGSKVYLEGKLQTRKWQDNQGQDRYTTEIVIDINGQMQMLDRRSDDMSQNDFASTPQANMSSGQHAPSPMQPNVNPVSATQPSSAMPDSSYGAPHQNIPKKTGTPQNPAMPAGFDSFDDDIPF